jgi:hypothetical protein
MPEQYFDYKKARADGVPDAQILSFLLTKNPKFDYNGARKDSVPDEKIIEFLSGQPGLSTDEQSNAALPSNQAKDWRRSTVQNMMDQGPALIGAGIGGALGTPLGPLGMIGGAGMGAAIGRGTQNAVKAAQGDPSAPQTFPQAMGDVSLSTVGGMFDAAPLALSRAIAPGVAAASPYRNLIKQPMNFKEAKEFIANSPIINADRVMGNQVARSELATGIRGERNAIQRGAQQQLADEVNPLRTEQAVLRDARTRTRQALQQERALAEQSHTLAPKLLRAEKKATIESVKLRAAQDANAFAKSVGKEMDSLTMAGKSREARDAFVAQFQKRIGGKYDEIREYFSLPENASAYPAPTELDPTATRTINAPADLVKAKAELQPIYDQLRGELQVARQQGSPGANLVIQFMEGEDVIDGATLIQNLKAANQVGYSRGDYLMTNPQSRGLAKLVGQKYRDALDELVTKLEVGRDEVRELFEGAKADLAKRDELFKTKAALSSKSSVERYGDAARLANDPIGFQAWWKQMELDPEIKQAAKSDMIQQLLGKDSREFSKNWGRLSPEIKSTAFSPQEITMGDTIAGGQSRSIGEVVKAYAQKEAVLNSTMAAETKAIRDGRTQLQGLQININELSRKALTAEEKQRAFLDAQRARLMDKVAEAKLNLQRTESANRITYLRQSREAKDKVAQIQALTTIGWKLGGGVGLAYGGTKVIHAVYDALGGFGN